MTGASLGLRLPKGMLMGHPALGRPVEGLGFGVQWYANGNHWWEAKKYQYTSFSHRCKKKFLKNF